MSKTPLEKLAVLFAPLARIILSFGRKKSKKEKREEELKPKSRSSMDSESHESKYWREHYQKREPEEKTLTQHSSRRKVNESE